ncbi:MAG: MFS transporter [Jatrophihabitantaceae bacterium]
MAELRTVLGTHEVPTLLSTSMIGRLPTAMATLSVLLLVRGEGGDYTLAGTLAALFIAGTSVGQPTLARVVDRRGQRGVLLAAATISTAGFTVLAIAGAHHPVVAAGAAIVAGLATPPLEPCLRAIWPRLVADGPVLRAAFSLDVGLQEIVFVVGPLLAVAGVSALGHAGGVLGCALFGLAGTLAFAVTAASRGWRPTPSGSGTHGSPMHHFVLVRMFVVAVAVAVPVGAFPIVAAAFADRHGSSSITGWALALNAGGALVSGLYGAVRPLQHATSRGVTATGLLLALGYLPPALPLPTPLWLVTAATAGLALSVVLGMIFQRIQELAPANLLTEANAWVVTSFGLGSAVAALVAGVVIDRLHGGAAIPVILGAAALVTAMTCLLAHRPDVPVRPVQRVG